jgi:glyoxylase I family protein
MGIPFQVAELDHVVVRCRDQARMLDFYSRVLGLAEERRIGTIGLIQLRAGASLIDLVPANTPLDPAGRNVDHFCLGVVVGDFAATIAYLRGEGVAIAGEPVTRYGARGNGLSLYIHDPEGNMIELKQLPAGVVQR